MTASQLALFGDGRGISSSKDCPQNGRVLVCWWARCWLDLRPASGDCADCSQVVAMPLEKVRPYDRVVGNGRER